MQYVGKCGADCLKEPGCIGVVYKPNHFCQSKNSMMGNDNRNGTYSMAVVNRDRYF